MGKETAIFSVTLFVLSSCAAEKPNPEAAISKKTDGQQIIRPATVEVVNDGKLK